MKRVVENLRFEHLFSRSTLLLLMLFSVLPDLSAQQSMNAANLLGQEYDLVIPKSKDTQY